MAAHTHTSFGRFVSPLFSRQTTVGICNIDALFPAVTPLLSSAGCGSLLVTGEEKQTL